VFFAKKVRDVYLKLRRVNSEQTGLRILAQCLMLNHIHLVGLLEAEESLAVCLRRTHGRYAQYINARKQRNGPGVAHHVTQRGTDRQRVFFSKKDREVYLKLLRIRQANHR
jgi:REP element-mobilizing transposase RayT